MRLRAILISLAVCVGLAVLAAVLFDWSLEKAILLAPVVVVVAGMTAFIVVLWTRIVVDSVRRRR